MRRALERHEAGDARVVPVILRPTDWQTADFAHLQALPRNGKPIAKWGSRDEAYVDVIRGLRGVVEIDPSRVEPRDAGGGRVVRGGGCWDSARDARSAFRGWVKPQAAGDDLGFRVLLPAASSSRA